MFSQYFTVKGRATNWVAPAGIIALDIDAPGPEYKKQPSLYFVMREKVTALANELAGKYSLGQWWGYDTRHGVHIIFESQTEDVDIVLRDAFKRDGFHECGGHYAQCIHGGHCVLRVSRKPGRTDFDIIPWNSNLWIRPEHVQEHDELLASGSV